MSAITTHVLDIATGLPAAGVPLRLERLAGDAWAELATGKTDADGRNRELLQPEDVLEPGTYRMTFDTAAYFEASGTLGFYPYVQVVFVIREDGEHYHVPLLLAPYGYSTYRGS